MKTFKYKFTASDGRTLTATRFGREWEWTNDQGQQCHTNEDGSGLWVQGGQVLGTMQYTLSKNPEKAGQRIMGAKSITVEEI